MPDLQLLDFSFFEPEPDDAGISTIQITVQSLENFDASKAKIVLRVFQPNGKVVYQCPAFTPIADPSAPPTLRSLREHLQSKPRVW